MSEEKIITAPIPKFVKMSGISRTQVYRLLDRGLLESAKVDDMRLIIIDSYHRLLETSRVPPKTAAQ